MLRVFQSAFGFMTQMSRRLHQTQIFHKLPDRDFANPELISKLMQKPLRGHQRVSQTGLYHKKRVTHGIRTCFSEKKSKVFKRVNKLKKWFYSDILNTRVKLTISMKAYRCIKKLGSFDNYILCTKPKDLDSFIGEYYRELMLRKINDPQYRLPYILKSNSKRRVKKYHTMLYRKEIGRQVIPHDFRKKLLTFQRKFGSSPEELSEEDYQKYLELEKLKNDSEVELEPNHPLLMELQKKLNQEVTEEEEETMAQIAKEAVEEYLKPGKHYQMRKINLEIEKKEAELYEIKSEEAFMKHNSVNNTNKQEADDE